MEGKLLKLAALFHMLASEFQSVKVTIYSKEELVSYLCLDLLWDRDCTKIFASLWSDKVTVTPFS